MSDLIYKQFAGTSGGHVYIPAAAWGVIKANSFGAMRTTSPYSRSAFSITNGYLPVNLQSIIRTPEGEF